MTTTQQRDQLSVSDQTDSELPGSSEEIWEGEELTLSRKFGDRLLNGWLPTTVHLPGKHVHPNTFTARGQEAVQTFRAAIQPLQTDLNECRQIEALLARTGMPGYSNLTRCQSAGSPRGAATRRR
jgi:hypothetical protein